jgi:2-polyprenyl-6-methoxyphenol hydroxylase-like FAD-dependent oxidoreductase
MLLARQGHRVLLVDRATFPSDTVSTHLVHQPGIAALARWGLLDRLIATGCPPIGSYLFDFGPVQIEGAPGSAYGPRRTVLDALLVDAAAEAGAEVRQGFGVDELLVEDGRVTGIRAADRVERAAVVVGADGRHSLVARAVGPEQYYEKPPLLAGYYAYWSGLPMSGRYETYVREDRAFSAWPTHHGQTLLVGGWPYAEFEANRADVEGNFLAMLELAPPFAGRVRAARRESRFAGASVHNYFRTPYGPGWALVGDAGYNRDFVTAMACRTPSATPSSVRARCTRHCPARGRTRSR